jgi:hypothetical protein
MSIVVSLNRVAGATFVVQSARLTDLNRLQLWSLTCVFGAIIGDWKTAVKFFTSGASAPAAVAALQATAASGAAYLYAAYTLTANTAIAALSIGTQPLYLSITQNATGGWTVTWDASFGTPPQPSQLPNAVTTYVFLPNGSSWRFMYEIANS